MKTISKIILGLTVVGSLTVATANGANVYQKCAGCHGATADRAALGKSAVIKGWEAQKTVAALKGYKDGTYGGPMKGLMKGQVASLSDEQIEAVAKFIEEQK
jgi:cytochrome c553